ncbi:MAG TPA: 16S rRNA (cytosine(967)-C(5))-methyltransferase RsmB [Candidatus Solibacter sp.]|nr:16S rRNA (cytosine(967)-C(5))-methyltransferase RsmB [Candidatus Solibacter sp.]
MPISPARTAAFDILLRVERQSSYASELLHSTNDLSAQDQALATELVMGTLRWQSTLDNEISKASSQPLKKLDPEILTALRLALYQFRHLNRIPPRAALHESVELVKRARKRSAAPFVNAVLRKLSTQPQWPSVSSVPSVVKELSPQSLAAELAHPQWLIERWTQTYGINATQQICEYNQEIPQTTIRLRDSNAEQQLIQEGIKLTPGAFLNSARRVGSGDVTKTQAFRTGNITIQDEASQLVAALMGETQKPIRILDACAAPGGKTLAIADRYPQSKITAVELHPHRARAMKERFQKSGADQIQVLTADATSLPVTEKFDRILADVPCSGTGTLARNPEIKWRLKPENLQQLQRRQIAILRSAVQHLAAGGRLIYSTCSLEKEENEDVIEQALNENPSVRLRSCAEELDRLAVSGEMWRGRPRPRAEDSTRPDSLTSGPYLRTIPGIHPCEGFFAAIIERRL